MKKNLLLLPTFAMALFCACTENVNQQESTYPQPCMEGNAGRGESRIEEAVRQRDTVGLERVGGGEEACVAGIFELEAVVALQDAERARERAAG